MLLTIMVSFVMMAQREPFSQSANAASYRPASLAMIQDRLQASSYSLVIRARNITRNPDRL